MKTLKLTFLLTCIFVIGYANPSQSKENKKSSGINQTILIDFTHLQKFWNNPENIHTGNLERVKYLTGEIVNAADPLGTNIKFVHDKIDSKQLKNCDVLYIHLPSSKYSEREVKAIDRFLKKDGSLFIVIEEDYWTTLQLNNINDIIHPFGLSYNRHIDDPTSGALPESGNNTTNSIKIPFHGSWNVIGEPPFVVYEKLDGGGKIIAMGDGMVSLYLTSWNGIDDYQCSEFMLDVFQWLLS